MPAKIKCDFPLFVVKKDKVAPENGVIILAHFTGR